LENPWSGKHPEKKMKEKHVSEKTDAGPKRTKKRGVPISGKGVVEREGAGKVGRNANKGAKEEDFVKGISYINFCSKEERREASICIGKAKRRAA